MTRPNTQKNQVYTCIISNPIVIWALALLCSYQEMRGLIATVVICSIIIDSGIETGSGLILDIFWKIFMMHSIYVLVRIIIEMILIQFYYPRCYYPGDYLTNAECWLRSFPRKSLFW